MKSTNQRFRSIWGMRRGSVVKYSSPSSSPPPPPPPPPSPSYNVSSNALVQLLTDQELIGPGQKALVYDQKLCRDWVYTATGDMGRWWMNTFVREEQVVSTRIDVCTHVEWLVSEIDRVSDIFCDDQNQHVLLEVQIKQLLSSISNLTKTYMGQPGIVCRLEDCMVRLLCSTTHIFSDRYIVRDDTEIHV